jgi:hypothetical protein
MRTLLRPIALFAFLALCTTAVQSQQPGGVDGGVAPPGNGMLFAPGSPSPTKGGVDVSVTISPATGYTCTSVTISCVDQNGKTIATTTINNPGATAAQSFTGLGNGVNVTVVVNSVFQAGNQFDYPYLEGSAITN